MKERSVLPPLVVHIIYRLAIGGMENGLVNLINRMPADRYRHAIICIDDFTDFRKRIQREDVQVYALHKKPGHDPGVYWRCWRLLRRLKPAIVHTRNLGALEFQVIAWFAGVPVRVQSEHGRDTTDLKGDKRKYLRLRRLINPFVSWHIALSKDLESWLQNGVRLDKQHINQIYNGVDTQRFIPAVARAKLPQDDFADDKSIVIGTIGRMKDEKDQLTLVRAFIQLIERIENGRQLLRLVIIGDGPLHDQALTLLRQADAESIAWLPGNRDDTPHIYQALDIFILPSLIEGISNTILEAMASGLPVVATAVGGNPELVIEGETGRLIESANPAVMADAIQYYIESLEARQQHGAAGRQRAEKQFSMDSMVSAYLNVYDHCLGTENTSPSLDASKIKQSLEK